jgi:DNA/RNA endonuclease YhcR with UshA esterase domain
VIITGLEYLYALDYFYLMIEKPKLLAIVITVSLAGILGLYAYAVSIESKSMSIGDLDSGDLGSIVEVEAYIKAVDIWSSGDLNLELVDYGSGQSLDVKVDADAAGNLNNPEKLVPGAKIRVSGLLEDYQGELQIHVLSSEGITLLQTAQGNVLSLAVILDRPEVFQGIFVVVRGNVWNIDIIESIDAITFTLHNTSDWDFRSVNCIVFNATDLRDRDGNFIQSGDEIILEGVFEYYEKEGIWQIVSEDGTRGIEKLEL